MKPSMRVVLLGTLLASATPAFAQPATKPAPQERRIVAPVKRKQLTPDERKAQQAARVQAAREAREAAKEARKAANAARKAEFVAALEARKAKAVD